MINAGRVDVHQHLLPAEYVAALDRAGIGDAGGRALPEWSPGAAIALMDRHEIATGVLSLSTPGTYLGDGSGARDLTRSLNDGHAELVKDHPDRFGMFAAVPLPDVDLALDAIAHAYDDLHTDGVVLLTSNQGQYLGDPAFEPVMEELDARGAVVFVHPTELPGPPTPEVPPFAADFLLSTTRAAYRMVRNGVMIRHPNLKIVLSHAGGFVPYAAHRMAEGLAADTGRTRDAVLDELGSFYFDTALSGSATALPSLLAFARHDHILFGSDWPFASDDVVGRFTRGLDEYLAGAGGRPELAAPIDHGNAAALFPRTTR